MKIQTFGEYAFLDQFRGEKIIATVQIKKNCSIGIAGMNQVQLGSTKLQK